MLKKFVAVVTLVAAGGVFAQQAPQGPGPRPQGGDSMRGQGGPAMSRADFMAQAGRHFDQIDSNKDGVASRDERRAFHQQHRMERGMGGERRNGPPPQDGARPQGQGPAGMGQPLQGAPR